MKKILSLVILLLLFGCSVTDDSSRSGINIRLSNVSPYEFHNIVVNTTTGNIDFGALKSGQKTEYKTFETAYRYAFFELEIEGETYSIQPRDYVGETPLENGNYTYQIDTDDSQEQHGKLTLNLIEE